jgi:hypothetical protein
VARLRTFCLTLLVCLVPAQGKVNAIDDAQCASMKAHQVMSDRAPLGCARLSLVTFRYIDFAGVSHDDGEIVVMDAVALRVQRIFETLYERRFPVSKARLLNAYDGDDEASMADNNTSSFNDRPVTGGSRPSLHAYGAAIDLNPVQNPFIRRAGTGLSVEPPAGLDYINRARQRPGKTDRAGMAEAAVDVFLENGFTVWGGYWDEPLDYQHFDIGRPLAETLAALPPEEARKRFEQAVNAYCRAHSCAPEQP